MSTPRTKEEAERIHEIKVGEMKEDLIFILQMQVLKSMVIATIDSIYDPQSAETAALVKDCRDNMTRINSRPNTSRKEDQKETAVWLLKRIAEYIGSMLD